MLKYSRVVALVAVVFLAFTCMAQAQTAAATRTWVSGVGDDANPCSRTAPCKTFAGAISKTAAGGEIDALDPGGFGSVTITKSITIDGGGNIAGILASGANGIVVNDAGAGTAVVTLRNLDLEGAGNGPGPSGIRGITFISGAALHVQNCIIRNFRDNTNSEGIAFTPSGNAKLNIEDTIITGNGNSSGGGGIAIQPSGSGSAKAVLTHVSFENNVSHGLLVDSAGSTGAGSTVIVTDSVFSGSKAGVTVSAPAGAPQNAVTLSRVNVSNNSSQGIITIGTNLAHVRVNDSVITGNATGVIANGASLLESYGNNVLDGNTTNGNFTTGATPLPRR